MAQGRLGVVAGSGVVVEELVPARRATTTRPGDAQPVVVHEQDGIVAIQRHGDGIPAHRVDHAANMRALVDAGVDRVVAVASTGTLRPDWPVGTVVVPDDFFAPWVHPTTFDDARGHAVPGFDDGWRRALVAAWDEHASAPAIDGGVYVQAVGPRFETPAEIRFFATVGDVVGMTVAAECIVAGELGLRYAAVCVVDNLANGVAETPLTLESYRQGAAANRERFSGDVRAVLAAMA